jgi:Calcineurin-like phosphoesterase
MDQEKKNFPQDLNDWNEYRGMVHWFSPIVLLKTAKKVAFSTLFGRYADRRLVHAALDSPINTETLIDDCCGGSTGICGDKDQSEVWVDYVADIGDGFDSTYAIAYLIGQKSIEVDGGLKLPRADCLIMGGDEVYPDASQDDYHHRMQRPYRAAFPKNSKPGACHPPVYLIPGNHDWYDGLTLFLAKFCRGRATSLGSWVASQRRSYFAFQLKDNWWIWGFDSQLGEDIDEPQSNYFASVARKMPPNAKVVLCASVPTWLKADLAGDVKGQEEYYRGLHYIASIIRNECENAKIPLVLAGDLHHYSRYVDKESGTNFITAGGGGAFLHPTHHLSDSLKVIWSTPKQEQTLEVAQTGAEMKKAFYPSKETSRRLVLGNLKFPLKNWDFCLVLGFLYLVCAWLMLGWNGYGESGGTGSFLYRFWNQINILSPTPIFLIIAIAFCLLLIKTAEIKSTARKYLIGSLHALSHLTLVLFGIAFISTLIAFWGLQTVFLIGDILYFLSLSIGMLSLGFVGGAIWGIYLTAVSFLWGDESNNAFCGMRLDSYKLFLRLRFDGDTLSVYPIGIDKSPSRQDWKMNDKYVDADPDQDTPAIVPKLKLGQHLIEPPIILDINKIDHNKTA